MKQLLCMTRIAVFIIISASSAMALTIMNGDFETGDFDDWIMSGNSNSHVYYSPMDYNHFANLYATAGMEQMVEWKEGDIISFEWKFIAIDSMPYNDFAQFIIQDLDKNFIHQVTLADVESTGGGNSTDWMAYSYTFDQAGSGSILFNVENLWDEEVDSQLFVDNVTATSPVPEPATLLLLGAGILGLISRKKFSKN